MPQEYKYDCLAYSQRPDQGSVPQFCIFHAPVGEVLQWADIERLEAGPGGAQRGLNDAKVRSVKRYLDDEANTIPTAVIIALDLPDGALESSPRRKSATLRIKVRPRKPKPGVIIDGQHRLLGMREFDPSIHVNIVALLTGEEDETAFQFLVINNKAAKVVTDHIKALLAERDDERLKERLRKARLTISPRYGFVAIADSDEESPFCQRIDWPINRDGVKWVKPAAIETAIKDIQDRRVPEFEDHDNLIEYFFTMWRAIKDKWPTLWSSESKLLNKVGIVCMTQYMTNSIVSSYDLEELDVTSLKDVDKRVRHLLKMQRRDFWTAEWSSAGYDTQAGRKIIVDSLVQVARNVRQKVDWKDDVDVLSSD